MTAGDFDKRFEFQLERESDDYSESEDLNGAPVPDPWFTVFRTFGSLEPAGVSSSNTDERVDAITSHRIRIHYDRRYKHGMRAKLGQRLFRIEGAVNEREANEFLVLQADEVL